jgi:hypothetical protein
MLENLTKTLSKYGIVEVIKDDFVFTLLMKKDKESLTRFMVPLTIMKLCCDYLGDSKPNIEVMKNEEDFLLLVLKPKVAQ